MNMGSMSAFEAYQTKGGAGAKGKQHVVIGTLGHGTGTPVFDKDHKLVGCKAGELVYPVASCDYAVVNAAMTDFFKAAMGKGTPPPIPVATYFTLGDTSNASAPGNTWNTADSWPPSTAKTTAMYLSPGALTSSPPAVGNSSITAHPNDPTPTVGGRNLIPSNGVGPYDQATKVEQRQDVAVFSTPTLTAPLEITGRVKASLLLDIDTVDANVVVRLTDVYPDGRSMLMMEGDVRLALSGDETSIHLVAPGKPLRAEVDLGHISLILNQGHALRISIATSNSPKIWNNPNDGSSFGASHATPLPVTLNIHHGPEGSKLMLDIVA